MKTENLPRIITWLTALLTVIGIAVVPSIIFIISYESNVSSLKTAADIKANSISQLISANPVMWEYEHVRIKDLMSYGMYMANPVEIKTYNLQGDLIAAIERELSPPVISRKADLFDSGMKVGNIEMTMSLIPVIVRVAIVALIAFLIGVGFFLFFRYVPIKAMKKAEKALRISEEKYRDMMESANDAIFIVDGQFNYTYVNRTGVELLGYSKEELLTMNIFDVIPADQLSRSEVQFEKLRRNGSYRNFIGKIHTKNGRWLDVEVNSSAIINDGNFVGSRDILRDITERTMALEALRREKEKLQIYLDISAVIVVVINDDQTIQVINKKGCEILECTPEATIGTNWFDNFIPEKNREMGKEIYSLLMTGKSKPVEYFENTVLTKNREERIIAWYNSVLRDDQGNITGTMSSGVDITEREQMKQALIRSEARYADAARAAHLGHWIRDLISHSTYWSKEMYYIFGVDPDHFRPSYEMFLDMLHQDDRQRVKKQFESLVSDHGAINIHYRILRPDREVKLINAHIETVVDENGRVIKLNGIVQDITAQKKLEQVRLIGEWSKGLAQGIKNSLAGVLASIELLTEDKHFSEKENADILRAASEIDRIELTINSLLKFTTLEEPTLVKSNINDIIEKTVSFSMKHPSFALSQDNYDIVKELDLSVPDIMADPYQLQQALLNLISNALDAMSVGGMLSIKTLYEEDENLIQIFVSDTGTGVDDEIVKNLFEPFMTTKFKGTGMGLAIAKRYIEQHHGSIYLVKTSREGTTFNIKIPVL